MPAPLTILCAAKLHANQLERHLELLERCALVGRILVVRHEPVPQRLSKVENISFGSGSVAASSVRMYRTIGRTIDEQHVDWVIGFNPVPWASVAQLAARSRGLPTCLSVVGRDYLQLHAPWGWPFRAALRGATAVTSTGQLMLDGLAKLGVERSRLHVLPHSVDIERFSPSEEAKRFDVLSVGQLIARKRMDVLIQATKLLKDRGLLLTVGILGKGPEAANLRSLVTSLDLTDQVEFLGYRDDVETIVRQARVFCLVSDWEGVPFALMEAMAAGVVPVVTSVGTIEDWVIDGSNGAIVPNRDAGALAARLERLLQPSSGECARMRARLLAERERLSFEAGVAVWTDILQDRASVGRAR
jgi:glycosyltransferase involved in cell wall biosynthesis